MDEMKVKLSTKFMRGIVSKLIARSIKKKYGCKVDIQLNELDISQDISFADPIDSDAPSYSIKLQCDKIISANRLLDRNDLNYIKNGLEEYRDDERAKRESFTDKCLPIKF